MTDPKKKHWYQKAWGRFVAIIAGAGIIFGVFEGVYAVTTVWYEYQELKETVNGLVPGDSNFETRITHLEDYVHQKRKSYQVGFRVVIVTDENTNRQVKRKKYRQWNGVEHTVYQDKDSSQIKGYDVYFWIGEDGHKEYCN